MSRWGRSNLNKWNRFFSADPSRRWLKTIAILAATIYIFSLIPIFIVSIYAHPVADDYSFSYLTYQALQEGRGVPGLLAAAGKEVSNIYASWQGTFNAIFLFSLQPGIYGSSCYWLTTLILVSALSCSTFFFVDTVAQRFHLSRSYCVILSCGILIAQIQRMPSVAEGLYWYNGAIYYTFFYSLALLFFTLLFRLPHSRRPWVLFIICLLLATLLGGGNYTTALVCAEMLVLLLLVSLILYFKQGNSLPARIYPTEDGQEMKDPSGSVLSHLNCSNKKAAISHHNKSFLLRIFVLVIVLLIAFGISILAPGNSMRAGMMTGLSAPAAVAEGIKEAFGLAVSWLRLPELAIVILSIPIVNQISKMAVNCLNDYGISISYQFILEISGMTVLFGLFASQLVPPLYAMSDIGAGRQVNIYYYSFFWLLLGEMGGLLMIIGSVRRWTHKGRRNEKRSFYSFKAALCFIIVSALIWCCGILRKGIGSTSSGIVTKAYLAGEVQCYAEEYKAIDARLEQASRLHEKNVVLPGIPATPVCFESFDLSADDPDYWGNLALARYYGLDGITFNQ